MLVMAVQGLREKHKRLRAAQVLDAAALLFARQGYDRTRIEEIAESASVAPATIYNYFATKPNLLMALAVRHVRAALPARRAVIRDPHPDPLQGINAFEELLTKQAMRHLSRECWRVILAAQHLEPGSQAHRAGARLNSLIQRQYIQLLRLYQSRGRLQPWVDVHQLAELIVGITTWNFARFIASDSMNEAELLSLGRSQMSLIVAGLVRPGPAPLDEGRPG
jgi:AcrR family transcriptional regulator